MNKFYPMGPAMSKLNTFLDEYVEGFTRSTGSNLKWLSTSIVALGGAPSIRFLHEHFLEEHAGMSLNSLYYALAYAARPEPLGFASVTARKLLECIPEELKEYPIDLSLDDTILPKVGEKFEHVKTLFDHSSHADDKYVNAHNIVTLVMSVPVELGEDGRPRYLSAPLQHRMWVPDGKSKLEIGKEMILEVRDVLEERTVILLVDSWYPKQPLLGVLNEWPELEMICAARKDTELFDLAPPRTGKRGRPRKWGDKLNIDGDDFRFKDVGLDGYVLAVRQVLPKIFEGREVTAFVTKPADGTGLRRLFLSTVSPDRLAKLMHLPLDQGARALVDAYSMRWVAEVTYFELQGWWNMGDYRVRSEAGINLLLNLEAVTYAAMKILPWHDSELEHLHGKSAQEVRFYLGRRIQRELILGQLADDARRGKFVPGVLEQIEAAIRHLLEAA